MQGSRDSEREKRLAAGQRERRDDTQTMTTQPVSRHTTTRSEMLTKHQHIQKQDHFLGIWYRRTAHLGSPPHFSSRWINLGYLTAVTGVDL